MSAGRTIGKLFARRSRTATRYLAAIVGCVTVIAITGVFGLMQFLNTASQRGADRDMGPFTQTGCVQGQYRYTSHELQQYEHLLLGSTCENPPVPAGLMAFPEPGDVYISPGLAELRATDSSIARQLPEIAGVIDSSGLVHQDELRIVAGVEAFDGELPGGVATFDRFGSGKDYLANALRFDRRTLYVIGGFFTILPAAYLVAVATRLNARMRERQLGLLAVLGVDASAMQRALTWEAVITTGVGAAVGAVIAPVALTSLTPTFAGWSAFPGDLVPDWYVPVLAFAITIAVAAAVAWLTARRIATGAIKPSTAASTSKDTARVIVLSIGIIAGAASGWWNSDAAWPMVLGGRIATFIGLVLVTPTIIAKLGHRLAHDNSPLMAIIGQRLRTPSGTLVRSLAALASGLFVLSAGSTSVASLSEDPASLQAEIESNEHLTIEVRRPGPDVVAVVEQIRDRLVGPLTPSIDDPFITGELAGSCTAVQNAIGTPVNCDEAPFYVRLGPEVPLPDGIEATALNQVSRQSGALAGQLISVTDQAPTPTPTDRAFMTVPADRAQDLYDQLLSTGPEANVRTAGAAVVAGATELDNILDVFRWGAIVAVAASFLAALFSLIALLHDRHAGNNYLQIIGVKPRHAGQLAFSEVLASATAVIAVSTFASAIWALSFSVDSDNDFVGFVGLVSPFAFALAALGVCSAIITGLTLKGSAASVVPDRDGLAAPHDVYTSTA